MDKWQLVGILGLVSIAACWGLAIVLYRVGTTGSVARKLALLLVIEGVTLLTGEFPELASGLGLSFWEKFFASNPMLLFFAELGHSLGDVAMIALYPPFLALALDTKLTRPFADTRVRIGLAIGSGLLALAVVFSPSQIGYTLLYSMVTLLFVYAFVASIHAWRTAERGMARERAGIFALAFGLRDIGWGLSYAISAWLMWGQPELTAMTDLTDIGWLGKFVYALGTLLAVPLIAYGILRSHLFDIDLRIRWTIKQSTLATIFVTLMFLISEGADRFLSAELGNFAGLLAAAVVVFFLAPLQRFAERVATVAMPNTKNTPEYAAHRKMQVYEAAVAEAVPDGNISDRERALLNSLRESLGISAADADAIEGELLKSQAGIA
jgi:hypothetical protein